MANENFKTIQSVERALSIIQCIDGRTDGMSLNELSETLSLNVGTVRGLAMTLLSNGYLMKNENTNRFFLGYEFLIKSQQVSEGYVRFLRTCAYSYMEQIANHHQVNVWLQISLHNRIYTIDVVESENAFYTYSPKPGINVPLHASVSGKLYVASLTKEERDILISNLDLKKLAPNTITERKLFAEEIDKALKQGYAVVNEETDIGMSGVGAPIYGSGNRLAGTLSVVAPTSLLNMKLDGLIPELKAACEKTSALLLSLDKKIL